MSLLVRIHARRDTRLVPPCLLAALALCGSERGPPLGVGTALDGVLTRGPSGQAL